MILKGAAALRYLASPDPSHAGLLIHGADPMRVALKRQEVVLALIGPQGEGEMRLARITAAELRRDPSLLSDAMRASGFFPGDRAVLVEDATDGLAALIGAALAEWRPGDARLVVTGNLLTGKSTLKALFETGRATAALALYDDPPSREEIAAELARAGLTRIDRLAEEDLFALARSLEPGDFRQTLDKVALYKHGDPTPLTAEEVASLAPATIETEAGAVATAAADGQPAEVGRLMRRLDGQGVGPVTICIAALRHFRALQTAASDPAGAGAALNRMRGVPFKARDAMARQAGTWGARRLEQAVALLVETDLTLRSSSKAPLGAVMERAMLRIAWMARAR